jgi:hypothetical protein
MVRLLSRQHGRTGRRTQASPKATVQPRRRNAHMGGRPLQLLLQMSCDVTRVLRDGEVVPETIGAL